METGKSKNPASLGIGMMIVSFALMVYSASTLRLLVFALVIGIPAWTVGVAVLHRTPYRRTAWSLTTLLLLGLVVTGMGVYVYRTTGQSMVP